MKHNITIRAKDKGIQAIVSYLYDSEIKWRTKSKQGFIKQSDAKRWANSMVVELAGLEGKATGEDLTLQEAGDLYLATKEGLAPNTYMIYQYMLNNLSQFNNIQLREITPTKTQEIQYSMPNGYKQHFVNFWRYLYKMKYIENDFLMPKRTVKSPVKNKVITKETFNEIIEYNKNRKTNIAITKPVLLEIEVYLRLLYTYGMRSGELLGLTPECVSNDKIIIKRQWNRISKDDYALYGFKPLKNGDSGYRELPSSPDIYKLINSLPFNFAEARYFTFNNPSKVNHCLRAFGLSVHDFRHNRASQMIHANYNLKYLAYFLGDTLDTVIKTYVHLDANMKQEENKKFINNL